MLQRAGYEVELAHGAVRAHELKLTDDALPKCVLHYVDGLGRDSGLWRTFVAARDLRRLVRRDGYPIVHSHTSKAGAVARIATLGLGVRRVHTHHLNLLQQFSGIARYLTVAVEWALASVTDSTIMLSPALEAQYRRHRLIRRASRVIPPLTDPAIVPRLERRLAGELLELAFVGRLVPEKRLDRLAGALNSLSADSQVVLHVVGDGPTASYLEALDTTKIQLVRHGWVENPIPVLSRCDALVMSSDTEGVPLVAVEALRRGVPVVATRVGGLVDLVKSGENGLLCDPSSSSLAAAIQQLVDVPELRSQLADGATRTGAMYDPTVLALEHVEVYSDLLVASG